MNRETVAALQAYFSSRPEVSLAFIFGSAARGREISESDVDLAVYFSPAGQEVEWEENREYPSENEIWLAADRILGRNTDLVVLNRAPANLASEVLRTGIPVLIQNPFLLARFAALVDSAAEDYRQAMVEWWAIRERSRSLSPEDRIRLLRAIDFLERELADGDQFQKVSAEEYERNANLRRNLERWAENVMNAAIDIGKIILASRRAPLPETYAGILQALGKLEGFDPETAQKLGESAKLRNILAHEYLDLRFARLQRFVAQAEMICNQLMSFAREQAMDEGENKPVREE
ncbi:MAG: DUF86 domain-containing protein [Candidatus Liptonbacteria bacterium]|nr:DUF86 domain-containing protein [Candidatus Liptonbacteria bacterium]